MQVERAETQHSEFNFDYTTRQNRELSGQFQTSQFTQLDLDLNLSSSRAEQPAGPKTGTGAQHAS